MPSVATGANAANGPEVLPSDVETLLGVRHNSGDTGFVAGFGVWSTIMYATYLRSGVHRQQKLKISGVWKRGRNYQKPRLIECGWRNISSTA